MTTAAARRLCWSGIAINVVFVGWWAVEGAPLFAVIMLTIFTLHRLFDLGLLRFIAEVPGGGVSGPGREANIESEPV